MQASKRTRRTLILIATVVFILSNVLLVGHIINNRSQTESLLALENSDMRLSNNEIGFRNYDDEDSSIAINLKASIYNPHRFSLQEDNSVFSENDEWLTPSKLATLGFTIKDISPQEQKLLRNNYSRALLPKAQVKDIYFIAELGGPVYQKMFSWEKEKYEARLAEEKLKPALDDHGKPRTANKIEFYPPSRLWIIDAALQPQQLTEKYSDTQKYMILKGKLTVSHYLYFYNNNENNKRSWYFSIDTHDHIVLPKHLYQEFEAFYCIRDKKKPCGGSILIATGKNYEHWVKGFIPADNK